MSYLLVSSSKESPTDRLREVFNEALNKTEAEYRRIEQVSTGIYPPIQKVQRCAAFGKRQCSISDYESRYYGGDTGRYANTSKRSVEEVETYCFKLAEEMKAETETVHAQNLSAIESNVKLVANLKALMTSIGMPASRTWSDYGPTGRSRKRVEHKACAGYLDDISREIVCNDGYETAMADYNRFLEDIKSYAQQRRATEIEEQRKREQALAETEKSRLLGVYQGRYGLPVTTTSREVLDHVLDKDRHIRLAHYLYHNLAQIHESGLLSLERLAAVEQEAASRVSRCFDAAGNEIANARIALIEGERTLFIIQSHDPEQDYMIRQILADVLTAAELESVNKHASRLMSAKQDAERLEKAQKLTEYDGGLWYGETWYCDLETLLDRAEFGTAEERALWATPIHAYLSAPRQVIPHLDVSDVMEHWIDDRGWEDCEIDDFDGVAELQAALDQFVKTNESVVSHECDYGRVLLLEPFVREMEEEQRLSKRDREDSEGGLT